MMAIALAGNTKHRIFWTLDPASTDVVSGGPLLQEHQAFFDGLAIVLVWLLAGFPARDAGARKWSNYFAAVAGLDGILKVPSRRHVYFHVLEIAEDELATLHFFERNTKKTWTTTRACPF